MISNRKITLLSMAVAAALSLPMTEQASAADVYATETPVAVLQNHTFMPANPTKFFPLTTNYTVGGVNFMYAAVTLGGGAKFAVTSNLKLACMKTTSVGGAAIAVVGNPQSSNSGAVFFAVNTGITLVGSTNSASSYCKISAPGGFKMGGSNASKTMVFESWRKVAINTAHTTSSKAFISFTRGLAVSVVSGGNPATPATNDGMIDVATGSQKLKGTTPNVVPATLLSAYVGYVQYKPTSTTPIQAISAAGGATFSLLPSVANYEGTKKFTLNISGAPIANASKVSLNNTAACGAGIKPGVAPVGQAVTFTGVGGAALNAGAFVCLTYPGSTSISAGGLTASITKSTETTAWQFDFTSANTQLHELRKNGASFKLYNMNLPETMGGSATEVSNIRLYNTGATKGAVRATMYSSDGTQIGTPGGIVLDADTFVGRSAHVVKLADVLTALGITAYTGAQRPWLLLEGEVPSMDVQVVTRNKSTGVVVNMSPVTRNDNTN